MRKYLLSFLLLLFSCILANAQMQLNLPQASPRATISSTIGLTKVKVDYGSPSVKGRELWGKLIPFNTLWRAGANEATVVEFSTDVRILQENVPAGAYSLFTMPVDSTNWYLVLNKNTKLWGTEKYDPKEDLIRVPLSIQKGDFHENLIYTLKEVDASSARLFLNWGKIQLVIPIRVDTYAFVMDQIKDSLAVAKSTDWSAYAQAVNYLIQQNKDHELALNWINKSITIDENFYNTWLKAKLLAQKNEFKEALELAKKAQVLGKKDQEKYDEYAQEIEDALILWREKRFSMTNTYSPSTT